MNERANGVAYGLGDRLMGEVVEASTTEFLAQTVELDSAPPFGAFVEVATEDNLTIYGVVAHVQTAGIDPGSCRRARGWRRRRNRPRVRSTSKPRARTQGAQ